MSVLHRKTAPSEHGAAWGASTCQTAGEQASQNCHHEKDDTGNAGHLGQHLVSRGQACVVGTACTAVDGAGKALAVGVLACAGLAVTPMTGFAENTGVAEAVGTAILILYVISQIGFSGANLYYDSFLPDVTTEERMDRVSTMSYGLGYIGGSTIPLLL